MKNAMKLKALLKILQKKKAFLLNLLCKIL